MTNASTLRKLGILAASRGIFLSNALVCSNPAAVNRAEELFWEKRAEVYRETDHLFVRLLLLEWVVLVVAALIIAPESWRGGISQVDPQICAAVLLGGSVALVSLALVRRQSTKAVTRYTIAAAQMLLSGLLINLGGGRLETHFHVFCSLAILSFYRDWRVLVPATFVVAFDHFSRSVYWPYSIYGDLIASPWRSLEHCTWVMFAAIFLAISCLRSTQEMRAAAQRKAELETSQLAFEKTNRQLQSAHQANQLIMDNSKNVICSLDVQGRFLSTNPACRRLWGYEPEELIGRCYLVLVHPEDRARSKQVEDGTRTGSGRVSEFVNRCLRKDGTIIDVLWSTCWSAADEILFCVAHDVTEQQRAERALREAKEAADRANRAKSEFLSRMSHELRTPLNAILGFGQLLERQDPRTNQRPHVHHILTAGRHLLELINEVLDISRIESDRIHLSLEPVNVGVALKDAVDLVRPLATEHSVHLLSPPPSDADYFVLADNQRLKQVLLNILTNGVKYTPAGGTVTVRCSLAEEAVRVAVHDTGVGISSEMLPRVFTPFDRLGAEQLGVEGTGLGLALSRRLVQTMHGRIGVESVQGQGSTFWLELARTESPLGTVAADHLMVASPLRAGTERKRFVLYIEDNISNLMLVEQLLREEPGVRLLSAMQGRIGLDLARQHMPDLILLDLHLPDMPGADVLAELQADEVTRRIPTIVLTADATAGQLRRLLDAGARNYITKPIDVPRFYQLVEETTATQGERIVA